MLEEYVSDEDDSFKANDLLDGFKKVEKKIVRAKLIDGQPRIDGRDLDTVRPLFIETGVLKNTHGSALFTRGETQALVTSTLGSPRQAQLIDALEGEFKINSCFITISLHILWARQVLCRVQKEGKLDMEN